VGKPVITAITTYNNYNTERRMGESKRMASRQQTFAEATLVAYQARKLLVAVLLAAVEDAQSEDAKLAAEARRWLASEGVLWAEMLDIPPKKITQWVNDLAPLPYTQLSLGPGW
jgi:hypothetical protein